MQLNPYSFAKTTAGRLLFFSFDYAGLKYEPLHPLVVNGKCKCRLKLTYGNEIK